MRTMDAVKMRNGESEMLQRHHLERRIKMEAQFKSPALFLHITGMRMKRMIREWLDHVMS